MRIIYDGRRDTNPCFLVTGLAWGGMLAVSATAYLQNVLGVSPAQRVVPEASTEIWAAGWEAAGLAGGRHDRTDAARRSRGVLLEIIRTPEAHDA